MNIDARLINNSVFITCFILLLKPAWGMTFNGSIAASTVTVSGDVKVSSMTVSTMTISNLINTQGSTSGIKGLVLQTIFSSTTVNSTTTSTAPVAIPGMSATIALSNANDYVRISLSGILEASFDGSNYTPNVNLSIERDSTDLGQGAAFVTTNNLTGIPVGITITDSPGDISPHTYNATFDVGSSTTVFASFTASPAGSILLEEIAR